MGVSALFANLYIDLNKSYLNDNTAREILCCKLDNVITTLKGSKRMCRRASIGYSQYMCIK